MCAALAKPRVIMMHAVQLSALLGLHIPLPNSEFAQRMRLIPCTLLTRPSMIFLALIVMLETLCLVVTVMILPFVRCMQLQMVRVAIFLSYPALRR
jgi:hypothetical protein